MSSSETHFHNYYFLKNKITRTWEYWKWTPSNRDVRKRKEYLSRTCKFLLTKLCSWNLIKGMNTWAVLLCKVFWKILKMDKGELRQTELRTSKLMMMMLKALHPREKKEEMNSPAFEDCIDASIQEIEKCTNKDKERLIAVTSNSNVNVRTNGKTTKPRKQIWEEKLLCEDQDIAKKRNVKRKTVSLISSKLRLYQYYCMDA